MWSSTSPRAPQRNCGPSQALLAKLGASSAPSITGVGRSEGEVGNDPNAPVRVETADSRQWRPHRPSIASDAYDFTKQMHWRQLRTYELDLAEIDCTTVADCAVNAVRARRCSEAQLIASAQVADVLRAVDKVRHHSGRCRQCRSRGPASCVASGSPCRSQCQYIGQSMVAPKSSILRGLKPTCLSG